MAIHMEERMTLEELAQRIGPDVARAFSPYILDELRRAPEFQPRALVTSDYDPTTCAIYVSELGDDVVRRADKFFAALERDGEIDSVTLAKLVGAKSPRSLSGTLTSALKKRARALTLERPWDQPRNPHRTIWADRNDISRRMVEAIKSERSKRGI
jgi:hypothetical protein